MLVSFSPVVYLQLFFHNKFHIENAMLDNDQCTCKNMLEKSKQVNLHLNENETIVLMRKNFGYLWINYVWLEFPNWFLFNFYYTKKLNTQIVQVEML